MAESSILTLDQGTTSSRAIVFDQAGRVVSLAQTASDLGACVINYLKCTGLINESGTVRGARRHKGLVSRPTVVADAKIF